MLRPPCKRRRLFRKHESDKAGDFGRHSSAYSTRTKIVSTFVPILFKCYLENEGLGEVGRLSDILKQLLKQTDKVIVGDCTYRQNLIKLVEDST